MAKVKTLNRTGLVGEWILNGSALDSSGNGNNGSASNVVFTDTPRGMQSQCAVFNGSSSIIDLGTTQYNLNDFSYYIWIRPTTTTDLKSILIKRDNSAYSVYLEQRTSGGNIGLNYSLYDGGNNPSLNSNFELSVNKDYLIKISRNSSTNTMSLEIYGTGGLINKYSTTDTTIDGNLYDTGALQLGSAYTARTNFSGNIQTVRCYNYVTSDNLTQDILQEGLRQLSGIGYGSLFDGLTAYYNMQGDAQDVIGGNNGTVTGATLTTDRFGLTNSAYSFDGSSQRISVPTFIDADNYNSGFSISGWVKWNGSTSNSVIYWIPENGSWGACFLYILDSSTIQLRFGTGNPATSHVISYPMGTNWRFFIASHGPVYDKLYIDGVEVASFSSGTLANNSSSLYIGDNGAGSGYFGGMIDDMQFFSRYITSDEAKLLYQLSSTTPNLLPFRSNLPKTLQNGLVIWLNEQGKDLSGNGNHATLVNSPSVVRRYGEKGLSYNGSNQYLNCGNVSGANFGTGDFAVSFWFKPGTLTTYMRIINKYNSSPVNNGWEIRTGGSSATAGFIYTYDGADSYYETPSGYFDQGVWRFYTIARVGGVFRFYKDNSLFSSSSALTIRNVSNSYDVYIGVINAGGLSGYLNGSIINPQIHNHTSAQEIQMLYNGLYIK